VEEYYGKKRILHIARMEEYYEKGGGIWFIARLEKYYGNWRNIAYRDDGGLFRDVGGKLHTKKMKE
jgi:hypothetical protein